MDYRIIRTIYARAANLKERFVRFYHFVKHDFVIPFSFDKMRARRAVGANRNPYHGLAEIW